MQLVKLGAQLILKVLSSNFRLTLGFMSSTAFLSMWLSNTSTAAMVMPIVEAVAQQIISAQAQVKATQMTYCNGSVNPGLEMEGITCRYGHRGSSHMGNSHKFENSGLYV